MNISVSYIALRQVAEQLDDLRLDRHVERGDAFVGDDQLRDRPRARGRCRRAGTGRRSCCAACGRRIRGRARPGRAARRHRAGMSRGLRACPAPAAPRPASGRSSAAGFRRCTGPGTPSPSRAAASPAAARSRRDVGAVEADWPDEIGVRPRMARASVLLPLPDSPTMPTVSPGMTRRLTPSTALTASAAAEQAAARRSAHAGPRSRATGTAPGDWRFCGRAASRPPSGSEGWLAISDARVGMARRGEQAALLALLHHRGRRRITAMRSQVWATMPRSWVIRMTESPRLARMSISSRRICAWIVTSSAVVGSSAIRIFGLQDSAAAIIARWRMPPENSCG